jgi:4-diphosphocytidyl-2-C-methyl-D-erythritol kinase
MISFPNSKINLGLHVKNKREDGFHNIETVFYPIDICEVLEIVKSDRLKIQIYGIAIDGDINENICMKAYNLLKKDFNLPPVSIYLHKMIPVGAGLGGGSSDATFTIRLLNNLLELNLDDNKMEFYSRQIGSDCAFFIKNKPVFASGKGDKFRDININLEKHHILLVKPEIHINTQIAYSLIKPDNNRNSLKEIVEKPVTFWKNELVNDFEKPMFCRYPQLKAIKERLYREGAVYASMTGSGSALYGIFDKEPKEEVFREYGFVWKGKL